MSTTAARKIAISGPGLKKEGIIVLQFFFIGIFSYLELLVRNGFGIIECLIKGSARSVLGIHRCDLLR